MFLGKLLSGHLWRKSVLISVLIRSLVAFVRPYRCYFTWLAPSALCITVFLQAEVLFNIEVQDFCGPDCVIAEATGRVMRKSQYNSTDSEFTFGSFF